MPIDAPWDEIKKKKHLRFARRAWLSLEENAAEGFEHTRRGSPARRGRFFKAHHCRRGPEASGRKTFGAIRRQVSRSLQRDLRESRGRAARSPLSLLRKATALLPGDCFFAAGRSCGTTPRRMSTNLPSYRRALFCFAPRLITASNTAATSSIFYAEWTSINSAGRPNFAAIDG